MQQLISDPTPFLHTSVKVFPEVPLKALPSTKSCNTWGCCYSYESCALASPWKEARKVKGSRSTFCRPAGQASRKRSRGNGEMGLGHISWVRLRSHTLFQHFQLGRIRLLHVPNCSQWGRMYVGETCFVLNSASPHYTGSWEDLA